ncbi:TRAP transporter small permease [Variovorax sp.]|uniref:TRAP transporter small permease n=1 Tax=Variovorax sp. TaxID=1871043 RepID=UPI002D60F7CD|nr:TRAP transporter small permease [Variovorax sp.]HYP85518.1 TRAP transporter small permease [Variovorax sp.]
MQKLLAFLEAALRRLAELAIVALALLTLTDVLGRYIFKFPVHGSVELTELLMVVVIFTGILLATRTRAHVAVDLLAMHLPPRLLWLQQLFSDAAATGISLLLGLVSWEQARSAAEFHDQTTILGIPLAPMVFFMSILLFANSLLHLGQFVTTLGKGRGHA